jgi:hypothetical protein
MSLALAAAAATAADVNKTTLSSLRAIKAGKVSGKRNERNDRECGTLSGMPSGASLVTPLHRIPYGCNPTCNLESR